MDLKIDKTIKHRNTITHYVKSYIIKDWCNEPRTFNIFKKSDKNYLISKEFSSLDAALYHIEEYENSKKQIIKEDA